MRATHWLPRFVLLALCVAGPPALAQSPRGATPASPSSAVSITLKANDGLLVHGIYRPAPSPKGIILLFHQAGSGKGKYATIAPRLAAAGYASLAIDQRSGGALFGRNETAARSKHQASFTDAKQDLAAALRWAESRSLPIVLWGSSYSAGLVFLVAAENPGKVAAVMAFSPGEYLGDEHPVEAAARKVDVPVFVTSAKDDQEIAAARAILAAVPAQAKVQFIPVRGGVHGSSTLIASRNPSGAAAAWQAVSRFLAMVSP